MCRHAAAPGRGRVPVVPEALHQDGSPESPIPLECQMNVSLSKTALALATAFAFTAAPAFAQDKPDTEKEKVSYVVGMQVGQSLSQIKDEIDLDVVFQ